MALLRSSLALLAITGARSEGIYPSGHFDHVKKLSTDNVNDFVKEGVDAGKTVFVRWIASEG